MRIAEIRDGDIDARAGLIITDGQCMLACKPTPSSQWTNPKLDIPKGHIQAGELPLHAAIRECYEETNILFETWKLNKPRTILYDGSPLYVWEVRLSEMPPIEQLSCASTFVDNVTGIRHPEMVGYEYVSIYEIRSSGVFTKFQDGIGLCIQAYFKNETEYPFPDHRICADKLNLPDGIYTGLQSAYYITLNNGVKFKTIWGIKGRNIPCMVVIKAGFIYGRELS